MRTFALSFVAFVLSSEASTGGVNAAISSWDVFCLKYCVAASLLPLTMPSASVSLIFLMALVKMGPASPTASSAPLLIAKIALSTCPPNPILRRTVSAF